MTKQELAAVMERLEEYYKNFYSGGDKQRVLDAWYPMFKDDESGEVNRAVIAYICTEKFAPTVAGIKTIMAENRMAGQMTEVEAWQNVRDAVNYSTSRDQAKVQYEKLPPLLKRLVGSAGQLVSWLKISEDTFEGVIASNFQRSYRELARREAVYHAIPGQLQAEQRWRVEGPKEQPQPLPKPQSCAGLTPDQVVGFEMPDYMRPTVERWIAEGKMSRDEIRHKALHWDHTYALQNGQDEPFGEMAISWLDDETL